MSIVQRCDTDVLIPGYEASLSAKLNCVSETDPLLVFAHGFAGDKDEKGLFSEASNYFPDHGFSVLRFDFRGCGDNRDSFRNVRFLDLQTDLQNVFRFIEKDLPLRPESIGFVGFSLGASIAILANPKSVKAYAFWSPAIFTDKDMYPRYDTPEIRDELSRKGFFVKSGVEVGPGFLCDLKENSVRKKIQGICKPVLLVHGEADARISVSSTKEASQLFRRRANICIIPGANHSFNNSPVNKNYVFSASAKFFQKHLRASRADSANPSPSLFDRMNDGSTEDRERSL